MSEQRCHLVVTRQARQQFRELRRSMASVSGSQVTARNYMRALTDYIEQLPHFPLRGQASHCITRACRSSDSARPS